MLERSEDANLSAPGPLLEPKTTSNPRFCNIAKMESLAAEGPETLSMFLDIARAKHRKLQGLQLTRSPPGMSRGWVGGRGRSAYNLRLPTEGLRQGHGLRGRRPDYIYIYIYIYCRV